MEEGEKKIVFSTLREGIFPSFKEIHIRRVSSLLSRISEKVAYLYSY